MTYQQQAQEIFNNIIKVIEPTHEYRVERETTLTNELAIVLVEAIIKEGIFMKGSSDDDTNLVPIEDQWKLDERNSYWNNVLNEFKNRINHKP